MHIAVLEDDTDQRELIVAWLEGAGHSLQGFQDMHDLTVGLDTANCDLLLIDWMLPDAQGDEVIGWAREHLGWDVPLVVLTARDDEATTLAALQAGADDYLVKPFDLAELSARIKSVARRYAGNPNPIVTHGPLEIDLAARSIHRDGRPVTLTAREWALFEAFLQKPGQLLSKAVLEEKLYSFDAEVESNTIEVHVSRLRRKLAQHGSPAAIQTVRGVGYILGPPR